jgi:glutathione S-transferase
MDKKPIELFYWKIRGKGCNITHLLSALDLPFTYKQFTFDNREEYVNLKTSLMQGEYPLANLPMIRDPNNGNKYQAETNAIMMYLVQKYKPEAAPTLEELPDFMAHEGLVEDLAKALVTPSFSATDKEEYKKKVLASKDRHVSKFMNLAKNINSSGWVFKGRFTYLDVRLAYFTEILIAFEKELDADFAGEEAKKALVAHHEKVYAMGSIQKWRSSEQFVERPFLPAMFAKWG